MPKHFRSKEGMELGKKTLEFESVCDLSRRQYKRMTCSMFISNQVRLSAVLSPLVRGSVSVLIQFPMSWAQGFCHPGQRGKRSLARSTLELFMHQLSWWCPQQAYLWLPRLWHWVIDSHTATAIWDLLSTRYCHPWNLLSLCFRTSCQLGGT